MKNVVFVRVSAIAKFGDCFRINDVLAKSAQPGLAGNEPRSRYKW